MLLLFALSETARKLSYQTGWPKHFLTHPRFECTPVDVLSRWPRVPRGRYDAVVVLHSVFSNQRYLGGRLFRRIAAMRQPKAYFVGNEYKSMPEKVEFCGELGVSLVVSQLADPAAHDLYRQRLGVEVAAIPSSGLDPELFRPRTPRAERPIDLGYRALPASWYIGHLEREEIAERYREAAGRHGLEVDLSLAEQDRFDESGWAAFLDSCRGQLGTEAGGDFFELTGETAEAVTSFHRANPDVPFDELKARFFPRPPGPSGRALSGRVVEAAGTKTVQLLLAGEYGGYFRPGEHYIAIRKDWSNVDETIEQFHDEALCARLCEAAYEVAVAELTYERLIDRFHDALAPHC